MKDPKLLTFTSENWKVFNTESTYKDEVDRSIITNGRYMSTMGVCETE